MKSVLKTFSQNTWSMLSKACLAVLCVFVFSSSGTSQSFMEANDAQVLLKPILKDLQISSLEYEPTSAVKLETDNGVVVTTNTTNSNSVTEQVFVLRSEYFNSLSTYIGWVNYQNVVSNAIERNHQKMLRDNPLASAELEQLKLEATNLLTN